MAQPQSLLQSFSSALPTYTYLGGRHNAHEGGTTSKNTPPPKFAVQRPQNDRWSRRGQTYLANLQNTGISPQAPGHALFSQFNSERIYNKENAILHRNEADVVRTAALYLIHPVCQALAANPIANGTFASQCEDNSTDGVRTDITFNKATPNSVNRPFAVVEFKRRTIIKRAEMDAALRNYDPTAPTAAADLARILAAVPPAGRGQIHPTLFMSGSTHLLKQVSAYAINKRTRYVALFDYDHLVCFYFPELDDTQQTGPAVIAAGGVGNYVEIDFYPFAESNQMRRALLGFLEDAYVNTPP